MEYDRVLRRSSVSHNFLLTFKFLALKEVKIRESLESGDGEGDDGNQPEDEAKLKERESTTGLLHVNLDMQNQMLGNAVDAGLRKVRLHKTENDPTTSSISTTDESSITEILEMLYKVCEKRRRVLAELESFAGASNSLSNCKLMAAIYHFEVCAKSRRHSHMATLLGEIGNDRFII